MFRFRFRARLATSSLQFISMRRMTNGAPRVQIDEIKLDRRVREGGIDVGVRDVEIQRVVDALGEEVDGELLLHRISHLDRRLQGWVEGVVDGQGTCDCQDHILVK